MSDDARSPSPSPWPTDPKGRTAPGFERHIFVCTNEREPGHARGCCLHRGGAEIRDRLKAAVAKRGLAGRVRVNQAGCLDFCEFGPSLVVYPDAVWYTIHDPERDIDEIIEQHLQRGQPVERCRMRLTPPDGAT